jgi:hypothetical protein
VDNVEIKETVFNGLFWQANKNCREKKTVKNGSRLRYGDNTGLAPQRGCRAGDPA